MSSRLIWPATIVMAPPARWAAAPLVPTMMPGVLMLTVPGSMLQAPAMSSVEPADMLIVPLKASLIGTSIFSVALVKVLTTPMPLVPSRSSRALGSAAVICSVVAGGMRTIPKDLAVSGSVVVEEHCRRGGRGVQLNQPVARERAAGVEVQ